METQDLLLLPVSHQKTAWDTIDKEITVSHALNEIKQGRYSHQISQLRALIQQSKIAEYNFHKKTLPGVTFSGAFDKQRKKDKIKTYNNIIVIDIDKLSIDKVKATKSVLKNDPYVFSYWISPSGNGIKGLVHITSINIAPNVQLSIDSFHTITFQQLKTYFFERYKIEIDQSGSDLTRLCFLSHDEELEIKPLLKPFMPLIPATAESVPIKKSVPRIGRSELIKNILHNPNNKNSPGNRKRVSAIIKYLRKTNQSITYEYYNWVRVAFAISNSFTYDLGERYFLELSQLDIDKFNSENCSNLLKYCYINSNQGNDFKTIIYLAKQKGFKIIEEKGEYLSGSQETDGSSLSAT